MWLHNSRISIHMDLHEAPRPLGSGVPLLVSYIVIKRMDSQTTEPLKNPVSVLEEIYNEFLNQICHSYHY